MTTQLISSVGLKPNGFSFDVARYPDTDFPIQSVSLPQISMGSAIQNTPQITIKYPGEKIMYEPLSVTFLLNSDMSNYIQIFQWMRDNAAPQGPTDFASLQAQFAKNTKNDDGQERFSDLNLNLLDNNNNPTICFTFIDAFPIGIGSITLTTMVDGHEYLTCDVTFDYTRFEVNEL
jgi:hypothetical protein